MWVAVVGFGHGGVGVAVPGEAEAQFRRSKWIACCTEARYFFIPEDVFAQWSWQIDSKAAFAFVGVSFLLRRLAVLSSSEACFRDSMRVEAFKQDVCFHPPDGPCEGKQQGSDCPRPALSSMSR